MSEAATFKGWCTRCDEPVTGSYEKDGLGYAHTSCLPGDDDD